MGLQFFAGNDIFISKKVALDGEKVRLTDVVYVLQTLVEMR